LHVNPAPVKQHRKGCRPALQFILGKERHTSHHGLAWPFRQLRERPLRKETAAGQEKGQCKKQQAGNLPTADLD
jgi:hypothetical protein